MVLEKYINNKTPIKHQCLKDGYVWSSRPQCMLEGSKCPRCIYNEAKDRYVQQLSIKHPNIILVEAYNASKEIKHKCLLDGYEWYARPACVLRAKGCPVCMGKRIGPAPEYKNSIWASEDRVYYERYLTEKQMKAYAPKSQKMIDMICPDCGQHKIQSPCRLRNQGLGCACSDGISYPNKLVWNVLHQLQIDIEREYSPTWAGRNRYDIYIPSINCIVENHGLQHYESSSGVFDDLDKTQQNDEYKRQLALMNGVNKYIILDCRKSNVEWIKSVILNSELPSLLSFNIDDINWIDAAIFATTNLTRKATDLYNQGYSVKNIAQYFGVHKETIRTWLKSMTSIGLCSYDSVLEGLKAHSKPVRCIELNQDYPSMAEAGRAFGVTKDAIHHCIKNGLNHTCAGYHWELIV
jgi:predicted DNA-binding protein YlxM (UPF0122 family)